MILKICPYCKKLHPIEEKCPNRRIAKQKDNKLYDKYLRKNKDVYNSSRWEKLRAHCLNKYDNICVYTLLKYKRIVQATVVHHIVEVSQNKNLAYELSNLIPLCVEAHAEIHKRYNNEDIKKVQSELQQYKYEYTKRYC